MTNPEYIGTFNHDVRNDDVLRDRIAKMAMTEAERQQYADDQARAFDLLYNPKMMTEEQMNVFSIVLEHGDLEEFQRGQLTHQNSEEELEVLGQDMIDYLTAIEAEDGQAS
jgi:hypothetical protein